MKKYREKRTTVEAFEAPIDMEVEGVSVKKGQIVVIGTDDKLDSVYTKIAFEQAFEEVKPETINLRLPPAQPYPSIPYPNPLPPPVATIDWGQAKLYK